MSDDDSMTSDESPESDATASGAGTPAADAGDTDAILPDAKAASAEAPVAAGATTAAASDRAGVFVPRWVAFLVGGLVALLLVGGAGFALGRATDDDNEARDHRPDIEARGPGAGIPFPIPGGPNDPRGGGSGRGNGGQGGGNGGQTVPRRVLLGVSAETATGSTEGARVAQVLPDGPAAAAGLEQNDVITKVDDTDIQTAADLVDTISAHGSGDNVTITYERDGKSTTVDVTLGGIGGSSSGASDSSSSTN
jgi:membrane-associated protease RseP (regulator of RpoE activity)